MNTMLLFRKRSSLAEDGLPWLRGAEEHPWPARRNTGGKGIVSATLVRALLNVLGGGVLEAWSARPANQVQALVRSHSSPEMATDCWLDWTANRCGVPHGDENKVTYYIGVLAIIQALAAPRSAQDFWAAYAQLLNAHRQYNLSAEIKQTLCQAADELYYWLRYANADPSAANCRLEALQIGPQRTNPAEVDLHRLNIAPLTDPDALRSLLNEPTNAHAQPSAVPLQEVPQPGGFVGWQAQALADALDNDENVLLAGPTGTGKTFALHQVMSGSQSLLVTIEGKEGLTDLDFIGAILPQADGSRRWVDGPLLQGRRYTIRLEPEGTGYHAPVEKIIQANPQLFSDQPVEVQFRITQGLLAHECGHA